MRYFKILSVLFILPALFSCKKEEVTISEPPIPNFNLPETPGTYWVYNWYRIDSANNETLLNISDSVYIVGDTIINGNKYTIKIEQYYGRPEVKRYRRDSIGYIVSNSGRVQYSYVNFQDTLNSGYRDFEGFWYEMMLEDNIEIVIASDSFNSIEKRTYYYDPTTIPFTYCGKEFYFTSVYYSRGIGNVLERTGYLYDLKNCQFSLERRLSHYNISN